MKKIIINKDNLNIFIIISLVFIISSNLAWLNPRPDFYVYKIFEYMPLFWQYNHDAPTELLTAAYFPYYFEEINIRVSRPGYPILIKLISTSISLVISPFYQMSQLYYAGIGFLILKFLIYLISAKLLFEVTKKYFNKIMAYVLIIVFYFHNRPSQKIEHPSYVINNYF